MVLKGIIFDLDGTLVDSRLDFAAMRADLGLAQGVPILEALALIIDQDERHKADAIVLRHEHQGAERATLMPGAAELIQSLHERGIKTAIFTRNAREVAALTLQRLQLPIDTVIAREDAPPKPDPTGLFKICEQWQCKVDEAVFVGDYLYDLEAGRRAGMRTVLYAPEPADFAHDADLVVAHLAEVAQLAG